MLRNYSLRRLAQRRVSTRLIVPAALAGLCFTAVGPDSALAADSKFYPGSACVPYGDSDTEISADSGASVENESTTGTYTVACPIVRDSTLNTNGPSGDVWVYVTRDSSTNNSLTCTIYSTRPTDGATIGSDSDTTTFNGNDRLELGLASSFAGGPYNLVCSLPALSKLHAYAVPERSPTD